MKFLLFFVSVVFSYIFYIFYNLWKWVDIFWSKINNPYEIQSLSWNLLIESFIFFLLWIIFLYTFSNLKNTKTDKIKNLKIEVFYFLFYINIVFFVFFYSNNINFFLFTILFLFIIGDMLFNHVSNISSLSIHKIKLRYIWLITNYITSLLLIFYTIKNWLSIIPFYLFIFNIIFNILVHKKYTNYISLIVSILIWLFLLYNLFFSLFKLYLKYI